MYTWHACTWGNIVNIPLFVKGNGIIYICIIWDLWDD